MVVWNESNPAQVGSPGRRGALLCRPARLSHVLCDNQQRHCEPRHHCPAWPAPLVLRTDSAEEPPAPPPRPPQQRGRPSPPLDQPPHGSFSRTRSVDPRNHLRGILATARPNRLGLEPHGRDPPSRTLQGPRHHCRGHSTRAKRSHSGRGHRRRTHVLCRREHHRGRPQPATRESDL